LKSRAVYLEDLADRDELAAELAGKCGYSAAGCKEKNGVEKWGLSPREKRIVLL
jgi:hypothetical protein